MSGTVAGGKKAKETNLRRYGSEYYVSIGRNGGKTSKGGAFDKVPGLAQSAGAKGGSVSRRRAKFHYEEINDEN